MIIGTVHFFFNFNGRVLINAKCMVPENIHIHPKEGHFLFQGRGMSHNLKFTQESMQPNWELQGIKVQNKKKNITWRGGGGEGMDFSGATHFPCFPL